MEGIRWRILPVCSARLLCPVCSAPFALPRLLCLVCSALFALTRSLCPVCFAHLLCLFALVLTCSGCLLCPFGPPACSAPLLWSSRLLAVFVFSLQSNHLFFVVWYACWSLPARLLCLFALPVRSACSLCPFALPTCFSHLLCPLALPACSACLLRRLALLFSFARSFARWFAPSFACCVYFGTCSVGIVEGVVV